MGGVDFFAGLICGYSPAVRERKPIVILQAFVDDSRSETGDKEFVLAGYMTTAAEWMKFSHEWSFVLDQSPAISSFHASDAHHLCGEFEGWKREERDKKVGRLIEVIERHPMASFDTRMSQASFKRILLPIAPHDLKSPYMVLFFAVIANAAQQLYANGINVPIDFVFDEQGGLGTNALLWHGFMVANLPEHLRPLIGSTPIFRDDKQVVPLQAADMLAWYLRRSRESRFKGEEYPIDRLRKNGHTETWVPDEMLQAWHDAFAMLPGISSVKRHSVKPFFAAVDSHIKKMPKERHSEAYREFDEAMNTILRADPKAVKVAMEIEKQSNAEKRKAKKPSALGRASGGKD